MFPNPQIEYTFIAQVLDVPSKFKKERITNKVTLPFLNSLCTSITCTLIRISIWGLGMSKKMIIFCLDLTIFSGRLGG